jgi:alpha,alpha-trehalase
VLLDYDGTLTPIVDRPELAVLDEATRRAVRRLALRCVVAIVSGRDLADVRERVAIDGIYYAGSHGFDIAGPGGLREAAQGALAAVPFLDAAEAELGGALAGVAGALLERKRFSIAVHYRLVQDRDVPAVEQAVDETLRRHGRLRKRSGKKVFELQPDIRWDKGAAVRWLLGALGLSGPGVLSLYIGDDVTDEDAFRALSGLGVGIIVRDRPRPTAAGYFLQDTREVREFLEILATHLESGQ